MSTVQSRDGTAIAYTRIGRGPALIFVDGALCHRGFGVSTKIAALLAENFTVYTYDRRGRGESGDARPYAIAREVEDLAALIQAAGGSAVVVGVSSGAALGLEAANAGLPIRKLALYEPPFIVDNARTPTPADFIDQLNRCLDAGRPGDAVKLFMRLVQMPAPAIFIMQLTPAWKKLKAVAHTLPYDLTIMLPNQLGRPLRPEQWADVRIPVLALDGGKSPAWIRNGVRSLAGIIPGARYGTLPGQTHMCKPSVLVPVLAEFLSG